MPPNQPQPIPDRSLSVEAWQDVLSRGFQVFAYYHWWSLAQLNPSFATETTCITIKNAALESSLMSIRDLDDFFMSKRKKPDDLIATDYGFPGGNDFLTAAEREAINKKLAHLTYRSVHELRRDPLRQNPRTWNNAEMVTRAINPFIEFLEHLESSFFQGDAAQIANICIARQMFKQTLKNINNVAQLEMEFTA